MKKLKYTVEEISRHLASHDGGDFWAKLTDWDKVREAYDKTDKFSDFIVELKKQGLSDELAAFITGAYVVCHSVMRYAENRGDIALFLAARPFHMTFLQKSDDEQSYVF